MKLAIYETQDELALRVATEVAQVVRYKPNCVLGLPTGDTPVSAYTELIKIYKNGDTDFSQVLTFNLDEYLGVSRFHQSSYYEFMQHNLFRHINIPVNNIHIPDGLASNPDEECKRYEDLIQKSGGMDLLILGIGHNGHIGFNEPGTSFDTLTHIVDLAQSTINANSRFFKKAEDVPRKAITMGIKTILSAKRIILMASKQDKSQIIYDALTKKMTTDIPASALQTHNDVTIMLDKHAALLFDK